MGSDNGWIEGLVKEDQARMLEERLTPEYLRFAMAFAGLFQLSHELLKSRILDGVRGFFAFGFDQKKDAEEFDRAVIQPARRAGIRNTFDACVRWLVDAEAITMDDAERLEVILRHRNELTHELPVFIMDTDRKLDLDLFVDAARILRRIETFWAGVELETGGFYQPETDDWITDVDPEEVQSLGLALLWQCVRALAPEGLDESEP